MGVRSWKCDQFRPPILSVCLGREMGVRSWRGAQLRAVIFSVCVSVCVCFVGGCKELEIREIHVRKNSNRRFGLHFGYYR